MGVAALRTAHGPVISRKHLPVTLPSAGWTLARRDARNIVGERVVASLRRSMRFGFAFPQSVGVRAAESPAFLATHSTNPCARGAAKGDGASRSFMLYVEPAAARASGAPGFVRAHSAARPVVRARRLVSVRGL
ncbi:hypothetical protein [Hansschlegelia zhihuaiae]|uniref:Uncharacterized protein n=1 Tax=Hansschlegelia zhihuaiae TaxID=405005 RepID=A0A4Q0MLS4_9HYPH|nr:hypothetical protein [Hansschlegelia zhihuaiae]RXF74767.1 hypothetical protein EK403_05160 [Hansschlegelia zhihuaiae]